MCRELDTGNGQKGKAGGLEPPKKRRIPIWEIPGGLQCSVIGTCFSHNDILKIARRLKLNIESGTHDYDVHAHFVREASQDCRAARILQKELDRRFSGIVRRVGRLTDGNELVQLWQEAYDSGNIAGAYWALLTHTHVSADLQKRAFGEVHMLSHVLGRTTHATALKASELYARIGELEDKIHRQSERHRRAIAVRDQRIEALAARQSGQGERAPATSAADTDKARSRRTARLLLGRERALISARQRARAAEAETRQLREKVRQLERKARRFERLNGRQDACPGAEACELDLPPQRVLYLGGRPSAIERLKAIAEDANAEMLHHDGGLEQTIDLIDGLITRCDAVFCPVDCISHGACERAKALCRKFAKRFVPLRSSGASSFKRALLDLHYQE